MIMNYFEKHDFTKLEKYIIDYRELKQGLQNEIYSDKKEYNVRCIVDGFEQTYNQCSEIPKKIIHLTWLDEKETDDVICKALDISKQKLNNIRRKVLMNFADAMGYA
ncbi:hypothetical protein NGC81_01790 [Staphylococcus xylosus]|uniref:hypothetical protein n=1 Tax=Staphylococcus xylosus TaxID=1288 RepID=UPI002DB9F7C3|nr:hypothetical protein [Staphylococcus xylosus]MEB7755334.1 hypothetical protein [Staphylococcus xylosus]